jgi:selT/selW/selH-like putative selenoprotein
LPQASSLGATLKREFGITPELIEGSRGIFDVAVDGAVIYSKKTTGRFPDHGEIVRSLQGRK